MNNYLKYEYVHIKLNVIDNLKFYGKYVYTIILRQIMKILIYNYL